MKEVNNDRDKKENMHRQVIHQQSREMSREEIECFLKGHSYGRLGLAFQNEPYVVPVAYGYDRGKIYFHSARQGKKLDFIKRNDRVCFEVDEWQKAWASVLCYGTVALRDDLEAKRKCFELLTGQQLDENRLQNLKVYVVVISLEEMTGRCNTDFGFPGGF